MTVVKGLDKLQLETVENCICLEDIQFKKVEFNSQFNGDSINFNTYDPSSKSLQSNTENINGTVKNTVTPSLYYYDGLVKVLVPKLMSSYHTSQPQDVTQNNPNTHLVNSSECAPNISSSISISNYIYAKFPPNLTTKSGLKYGDSLVCLFPNKNMTEPIITFY